VSHVRGVSELLIQFSFILQRVKEDNKGKTLIEVERKNKMRGSGRLRRKH
jgi:hypothetical protein